MDNKELSAKVWSNIEKSKKKAAKFEDDVVVSFSLISEKNDDDLYVAVINGELSVMPYRYNEFGCEIEASADTVNKLFSGALAFDKALSDGMAVVKGGDVAKFKALECLVPAKKTAKAADKKAPAKKTTAKKTTAKPAAKKPAAKKPAAKKATTAAKPAATAAKPAATAAKPAATAAKPAATAAKPAATAAKPAATATKPATTAAKPAEKKATAAVKPAAKK